MPALQFVPPQVKDLGGGFLVHRLLPSAARAAPGPLVFSEVVPLPERWPLA